MLVALGALGHPEDDTGSDGLLSSLPSMGGTQCDADWLTDSGSWTVIDTAASPARRVLASNSGSPVEAISPFKNSVSQFAVAALDTSSAWGSPHCDCPKKMVEGPLDPHCLATPIFPPGRS